MIPGPSRLLPFIAASVALHALVFVAGPDPLTVASTPAGSGHEVSIRLEAAAPAGAAAGPAGKSRSAQPRPAHRTQPPEPETIERTQRSTVAEPDSRESATRTVQREPVPASRPVEEPEPRTALPEPDRDPAERVAETDDPATGAASVNSPAQRAKARAAIVAELARHFRYPRLAQQRGWEGTVVLTVRILPDGRLDRIGVKRSSGRALLDRAAVRALAHVQRLPRFADRVGRNGLALEIPVTYRLEAA